MFNKFYIIFIIYSVLRNVGPQPVGLLLLTYLINEHHNVNFPLVRIVYFSSLLKTTRNLLATSLYDSLSASYEILLRVSLCQIPKPQVKFVPGNDRQNRLSRAALMPRSNVRNLRAVTNRLRLAENRYVQLHSTLGSHPRFNMPAYSYNKTSNNNCI